jgi:hypothetical protein
MSVLTSFGLAPLTETSSFYLTVAGSALVTAAGLVVLRAALWPRPPKLVRSPLRTALPRLSKSEIERLDYRPDFFPGARDVETPVSVSRVLCLGGKMLTESASMDPFVSTNGAP